MPTSPQNLVLLAFAEDKLGVNIVKLLEHTPMDDLTVVLYWQNLSPGAKSYTYRMRFGIRSQLSCNVIFGTYDFKGFGPPFDGELRRLNLGSAVEPFEPAVKRSLSKSRTDSWMSKLSKKSRSDSWRSIFSRKSRSSGTPDPKRELALSSTLNQETSVAANSTLETTMRPRWSPNLTAIVASFEAIEDDWSLLDLKEGLEAQESRLNSDNCNGPAAAEGSNKLSYMTKGINQQPYSTEHHDFGLSKGEVVPSRAKTSPAEQAAERVTASSFLTSVPLKPSRDGDLLGNDGNLSGLPSERPQIASFSGNLVPATLKSTKEQARSMGSKYSRSKSAYNAPPSDSDSSGDEAISQSQSNSKHIREPALVPYTGIEPGNIEHTEDEIPIVTEVFRHSPNRSLASHPDSPISGGRSSDRGESISRSRRRFREAEPSSAILNEQHIEQRKDSAEHSVKKSTSSRKRATKKRRKPADLITPKRFPRSTSDGMQLTPAPGAAEYWTWDNEVNAYFHHDSDTQSVIWLEDSASESDARA